MRDNFVQQIADDRGRTLAACADELRALTQQEPR